MKTSGRQGGYIALITVLIAGAAAIAIALAMLVSGTDNQRSALITQQSAAARNLARSCSEEALQQGRDNPAYTGTGNLGLGGGTCTYTVTNNGGSSRIIDASGVAGDVVRKIKIYATITTSSISITSWQEVN